MGFFIAAPSSVGPPPAILADNIDPETRDFASLAIGADVIDAQVQLAITTQRASGAAVIEDGIALSPRKMTASFQNEMEADARTALKRMTRNGDIRLVNVVFDSSDEANQTAQMRIRYENLRAADGKIRTSKPLPVPGKVV